MIARGISGNVIHDFENATSIPVILSIAVSWKTEKSRGTRMHDGDPVKSHETSERYALK